MKGGRHHVYHPLDSSFFCPASFSSMTKKFATKETAFERHSHVVSSHVFFKQSIPLVNSSRHIQSAFDTFLKTRYKGHKSRKTDTRRNIGDTSFRRPFHSHCVLYSVLYSETLVMMIPLTALIKRRSCCCLTNSTGVKACVKTQSLECHERLRWNVFPVKKEKKEGGKKREATNASIMYDHYCKGRELLGI